MKNKSLEEIEELVKQGDLDAMCELAYRKFEGEGTEVNDKEAIKWLEKSVEVNDDMGQWLLGTLYLEGNENGIEIEKNTEYGVELLQKSAEQGNEKAKEELKKIKQ